MGKISPELAAHLEGEVTTLCHCWRLTRSDGTVMGFTDHDRQLVCDGTTFRPETGLAASEARRSLGLAVDAMDVEGALAALDITEADIAAGDEQSELWAGGQQGGDIGCGRHNVLEVVEDE